MRVYALPDKLLLDAFAGPGVLVSDRGLVRLRGTLHAFGGAQTAPGGRGRRGPWRAPSARRDGLREGGRHLRAEIAFERETSLAEAEGARRLPAPGVGRCGGGDRSESQPVRLEP